MSKDSSYTEGARLCAEDVEATLDDIVLLKALRLSDDGIEFPLQKEKLDAVG